VPGPAVWAPCPCPFFCSCLIMGRDAMHARLDRWASPFPSAAFRALRQSIRLPICPSPLPVSLATYCASQPEKPAPAGCVQHRDHRARGPAGAVQRATPGNPSGGRLAHPTLNSHVPCPALPCQTRWPVAGYHAQAVSTLHAAAPCRPPPPHARLRACICPTLYLLAA